MKSFFRPKRSVSWPKNNAPKQAPATYTAAAIPMSLGFIAMPLPSSVSRAAIDPTIVTSSPSRIQTVPSPTTTRQWKRDQGSRSRRAGIRVRIVPVWTSLMAASSPARPFSGPPVPHAAVI